ncbi:hypothetical protein C1645_774505 [Glomus cerebriforme]|uniref:Uncharacterized protein n=1 Tax=Glomus cerebriforme TaxID=658196 RepID=A0A397T0H7_9GLOM|nr:hypothetical protein C1645_774505 [Glomus cerebriforme]
MESEEEEEAEIPDDESPITPIQLEDEEDTNTGTKRNNMNQELKDILSKIFVNASLEYYDEMEKAYYSANFLPVCFNCGSPEYIMPIPEKQYSYCETCISDPNVLIKTGKGLNFAESRGKKREKREKKLKK